MTLVGNGMTVFVFGPDGVHQCVGSKGSVPIGCSALPCAWTLIGVGTGSVAAKRFRNLLVAAKRTSFLQSVLSNAKCNDTDKEQSQKEALSSGYAFAFTRLSLEKSCMLIFFLPPRV